MLLTQQTLERLQKELAQATENRKKWNLAIGDAAGVNSDWHDNAAFDHAQSEYEVATALEQELKEKLEVVEIIKPRIDTRTIGLGNKVKILIDESEKTFTLLGPEDGSSQAGWLSVESPIGQAIVGKAKGDFVEFVVGNETRSLKILEVLAGEF